MGSRVKKEMQAIGKSQALLTEQMDELKRVVSVIRTSGDKEHLEDVTKMWMNLAKELKKQGERIKVCAMEVKQAVAQEPKPKKDFQSTMTDYEIRQLLPLINKYVFVESQTTESVKEWLCCRNKEPLRVKKNGMIAYLLSILQQKGFICWNPQKVAADNKTFMSINGKILNQKDLSKAQSVLAKKVSDKSSKINEPLYNKVQMMRLRKRIGLHD